VKAASKKRSKAAPPAQKGLAVEVQGLTVQFGDFKAVNDISFKVGRGEIFGFLGANGAGKTTTIRVLCGLLEPTAGVVRVAGLGFDQGANAIKSKVGYMSQKLTIYQDMSVAENMAFIASLRKMDEALFLKRKKELFSFIRFTHDEKALVRELPGGLKQEVSLAAAMLHDPEIVFLDEPTAGVAPASRNRFWHLIRKVAAGGKTVFVTTHYMDEAEQCGRIALMRDGKIIALDSPEGLERLAFPHPLYEISAPVGSPRAWIAKLQKVAGVEEIKTFGMRWHLSTKSKTAWTGIRRHLPKGFSFRRIQPRLEDVFIRMVEGHKK
jgi:ABC-2 type transport system ATP-binding protein